MMKKYNQMIQMNEKTHANSIDGSHNAVIDMVRAHKNNGIYVTYRDKNSNALSEINGMYDVYVVDESKPMQAMEVNNNMNNMRITKNMEYTGSEDALIRAGSLNEGSDVRAIADTTEPITVSRKVTHGKGRTAGKRAGRVSLLLGACALTLGLTVAVPSAGAQKLEQGVRSEHVLQLQEQLSDLGYFDAGMTGYYGTITKGAVRKFQQAQGLSADGVAGPATLNRLNKKAKAEGETLRQLAKLIHGEARGESFEGQVAVGAVVMNRVHSNAFPSSISKVIFQKGQFTAIDDGQFNTKPTQTSYRAARKALNGADPTNGALYYYNPKIATSVWSKSRPTLLTIGQHDFTR
ncbi:cell wall hydrolase [Paenibacillus amylolyticus]|uniref:Cell wall hydrolase SleB n=1 Tax=Paenibacillus amylolyticus TaxID=1451 RepID=A0A100VN91_PAEAM|nr:cell wall hydrolase [Paenibacillus amylolyticus]GAS82873.1 cell wall hydrolase SleB [Paenibacillus amylolyticus]